MSQTWPIDDILAKHADDPVRKARREQYNRAMTDALALGALREHRATSPVEAARPPAVGQTTISRLEHEEDLYLSTLRDYVEALGGRLEINAVFPDQTITLIPGSAGS